MKKKISGILISKLACTMCGVFFSYMQFLKHWFFSSRSDTHERLNVCAKVDKSFHKQTTKKNKKNDLFCCVLEHLSNVIRLHSEKSKFSLTCLCQISQSSPLWSAVKRKNGRKTLMCAKSISLLRKDLHKQTTSKQPYQVIWSEPG